MNSDYLQTPILRHSEIRMLFATAFIVLISRLPWVTAGLGTDPDAYRVFNVAMTLRETGEYFASRLPGYPVHEYLVAALVRLGPTGTNMLSTCLSVVAFVFFALILRQSGVRPYLLGAFGFVFTPVVYISSTMTIDYVPAIAFMLAATYFVLRHRFIVAGACLGVAIGFRITSGAMLLPLILWVALNLSKREAIRQSFQLVTTTLAVSIICFMPVFLQYGLDFFIFVDMSVYPSLLDFLGKVEHVWGLIGSITLFGLCLLMLFYIPRIKSYLAIKRILSLTLLAAVSIGIYIAAFLRLPYEPGYLIPVVPFTIMLLGLLLPSSHIRILSVALILSPFFITIHRDGISLKGAILEDHEARVSRHQQTISIVNTVEQLPKDSIVVVGWELPAIITYTRAHGKNHNQYISLIPNQDACSSYQNDGRPMLFLPGVNDYSKKKRGVDLRDCHAKKLLVLSED